MIGTLSPARATKPPSRSPPTKPSRDYLSYSAITTYQSCPLRYYFRYVADLPEKTVSSSLVFGSAVHRAVELHFNELMAGNEPPGLDALIGEYDRHWSEADPQAVQFGKDDDRESLGRLATRMFGAFQTSPLAMPVGRIIGVEEELRGAVVPGCPDLLGRIDLIVESADDMVITDLKTSRSRWSREQADDSAGQLHLYHELVRSFAPRKRMRLQFAVLTKTKEPAVDLYEVAADRPALDRTKRISNEYGRRSTAKSSIPHHHRCSVPVARFANSVGGGRMTNRRGQGDRRRPQVTSYEWLLIAAGLLGATIGGWEAVVGVTIGLGVLRQLSQHTNR